jgi:O-antigen ligase
MTNNMKSVYIGLLFLIFIIPLGRLPISFSEIPNLPQLEIIYIIFSLFLFICWLYISAFGNRKGFIKKSSLYLPLGLFILWSILSLKWTVSLSPTATQIFYFIFYFLIFFLSLNVINDDKARERLLLVLLFSTFLVSAYAVYQYFWGLEETRAYVQMYKNEIPLYSPGNFMSRLNTDRAFSTFLYPNALASFLMMIFPFSVFCAVFCKKKRIIAGIISLLILFAFILTFSKGGAIALILSWVLFGVVRMRKKYKIVTILVTLLLIALAIFFAYNNNYVAGRVKPFKDSLRVRLEYGQAGLEMIKEKPLHGFGLGCFGRMYAKYKLPKAEETQMAHNNFLQIWTELGIIGFLIFLSIFVFYFREMNRKLKNLNSFSPIQKVFILGGYVSVLAFIFHSLGDFSLYIFSVSFILFFLIGISCGVNSQEKELKNPGVAIVILSVVSLFLIFLLSKLFIAEEHYIRAMKSDSPDRAIKELNLSVRYWSWGEDEYRRGYHYILGQIYKQKMFQEKINFTPEIIKHLKQAVKYDQCRSLYWRELAWVYKELARVSLLKNQREKSIEYMEKSMEYMEEAISCYPTYGLNRLLLGDIYTILGRKEEALQEYKTALEFDASLKEEIDKRMQYLK